MADEIKTLEYATERAIRAILRGVMRDITTIEDFDYSVSRIERVGYERMHDAIAKVYLAGYNTAGRLIKKHFVTAAVRQVTDPFGDVHTIEDPLIAKHTTQMLNGVSMMAAAQRDDVMAALSTYYEKGYTADRIARALETFFDDDPYASRRFARTATNDIYNRAHLDRYRDSGVVDGVEFSAHIDDRTTDICRMLDGTIWAVNSDEIKTPPRHFNCCVAGTKVITEDGEENIETIEPGDLVLTRLYRYMPVIEVMNRDVDNVVEIKTSKRRLVVTKDHPIFIYSPLPNVNNECKVGWINSDEASVGDQVICIDNVGDATHEETITSVRKMGGESKKVYNLSVLQDETYYANGVLVHNCRSRLIPYFGKIPGERDFTKDFSQEFIDDAEQMEDGFQLKYWNF